MKVLNSSDFDKDKINDLVMLVDKIMTALQNGKLSLKSQVIEVKINGQPCIGYMNSSMIPRRILMGFGIKASDVSKKWVASRIAGAINSVLVPMNMNNFSQLLVAYESRKLTSKRPHPIPVMVLKLVVFVVALMENQLGEHAAVVPVEMMFVYAPNTAAEAVFEDVYLLSYNSTDPNRVLCQQYNSSFTDDKQTFTSAEQYMMYYKAMFFNDTENATPIVSSSLSDTAEYETAGSQITKFNSDT